MTKVMINMKKIKEGKDLSYLESWYCPLEKSVLSVNIRNSGKFNSFSNAVYAPRLIFEKKLISIPHRHVMAGF